VIPVAVELPEKQGLKRVWTNFISVPPLLCCSGTSRKTRIETYTIQELSRAALSCSGTSRKTRIETCGQYANDT